MWTEIFPRWTRKPSDPLTDTPNINTEAPKLSLKYHLADFKALQVGVAAYEDTNTHSQNVGPTPIYSANDPTPDAQGPAQKLR